MANLPQPGKRIGAVDGPGVFPSDNAGTVLCHVTGEFHTYALVLMDDGSTKDCHGVTERGIGWYVLTAEAA